MFVAWNKRLLTCDMMPNTRKLVSILACTSPELLLCMLILALVSYSIKSHVMKILDIFGPLKFMYYNPKYFEIIGPHLKHSTACVVSIQVLLNSFMPTKNAKIFQTCRDVIIIIRWLNSYCTLWSSTILFYSRKFIFIVWNDLDCCFDYIKLLSWLNTAR